MVDRVVCSLSLHNLVQEVEVADGGFLHHLGLWLVNGQSWKRGQSNSRNVFALSARVLGPRAFSLPVRMMREGGN